MKIGNISGLFDEQNVLEQLTQLGAPMVLIKEHIDFGIYKELLNKFFNRDEEAKSGRGCIPNCCTYPVGFNFCF